MNFLSVCSGIEAASVAWNPLGWEAVGFSEIESFPCAVLAHHYPTVPNFGDLTKWESWNVPAFDVLCGGTPCQGFSVAGKRGGMDDPRSQLAWHFLGLADRHKPRWIFWENVPGVLSSDGWRDFGAFLGELGKCGYGFAYRVLDAARFGVPSARERVFVVAYLGDWRPACAVLLEPECLSGDFETYDKRELFPCIYASHNAKWGSNQWVRSGFCVLDGGRPRRITPLENERLLGFPDNYTLIPIGGDCGDEEPDERTGAEVEPGHALRTDTGASGRDDCRTTGALRDLRMPVGVNASGDRPRPFERQGSRDSVPCLQHQAASRGGRGLAHAGVGIPGRTRVAADGPRYKALGNSWAVPVVRWIGKRMDMVFQ